MLRASPLGPWQTWMRGGDSRSAGGEGRGVHYVGSVETVSESHGSEALAQPSASQRTGHTFRQAGGPSRTRQEGNERDNEHAGDPGQPGSLEGPRCAIRPAEVEFATAASHWGEAPPGSTGTYGKHEKPAKNSARPPSGRTTTQKSTCWKAKAWPRKMQVRDHKATSAP
ncbi:hypothetical protein VTJ04DRAFT_1742 [Mycothermus thermophilus]|uniref:uncharacterized protein n=1 Tax=Humicola insolens TaxID=85995 RepID=UPI0037438CBE